MKLSIIIPIYNCMAFVEPCVTQFLEQLDVAFEVLLIDDGSTDGSGEICDMLQRQDARVRCVHQENGGVSRARNRGIELAQGDYILFVDADDTVEVALLSQLIRKTEEETSADLFLFGMFFDYYQHGENYRSDRVVCSKSGIMQKAQWGDQIAALFSANYLTPVWNKLFPRQRLLQSGVRFRPEMFLLEDLEFSIRYLAHCQTIVVSDDAIYHYRQPEDEGNAGRRLLRIESISEMIAPIEQAFFGLAEKLELKQTGFDGILLSIFLSLARQKIWASEIGTIKKVCRDFSSWAEEKQLNSELLADDFSQDMIKGRTIRLLCRRSYSKTRHRIANRVKYWRYKRRPSQY